MLPRFQLVTTTAMLFALLIVAGATASGSAIAPGPDNRGFATGLDGWTVEGREPVELGLVGGRPRAVLARNTSLVTPPATVPTNAQAFGVLARAPQGRALIVVRALVEGEAPTSLGVLEPGRRLEEHLVSVAGLGGQAVRFELDPVTSLGRTVQVGGVGPFRATLRGWSVTRGVASPIARSNRRFGVDEPLRASRRLRVPRRADAVSVRLRGEGSVQLTVAGARRRLRAGPDWRTLSVPIRARGRTVPVALLVRPGFGPLELADVGVVSRA